MVATFPPSSPPSPSLACGSSRSHRSSPLASFPTQPAKEGPLPSTDARRRRGKIMEGCGGGARREAIIVIHLKKIGKRF